MGIFFSFVKKEIYHLIRDARTMVLAVVMPIVLLLLFGFAISTEVNDIRIVISAERPGQRISEVAKRFEVNPYFSFLGMTSASEIYPLMQRGEIDAAVVFKENKGDIAPQIIVDASNPVTARSASMYITGVLSGKGMQTPTVTRVLYNPQLKSSYNFVPGILGMIFILICAILTSVSIVREKETGTMNLLLVSPIRPRVIIFGKLVPYFLLSCVILAAMLLMSFTVLGIPVSSHIGWVILFSMVYIILSLSIGLLVSTLVSTQVAALVVSAVLFMIPVLMLSGMIFPISNFPMPLQYISGVIPARWYVSAIRKLMIQQLPVGYVIKELCILLSMTVVILGVALKKFNSK